MKPFPDIKTWPWRDLNFTQMVGLNDVTPFGIQQLQERLALNSTLTLEYLVSKSGFNFTDHIEREKALRIYKDWDLLTD